MQDKIFDDCKKISVLLNQGFQKDARDALIIMLDELCKKNIEYSEVVNHLIRQTGLYPYMQGEKQIWQDKLLYELFKYDVGNKEPVVLHREQSKVLKSLIEGESIAISAPTSFGKSFIIDAYIKNVSPNNVVIVVPTIALTDETRRRLYKKFAQEYKIITTPESELGAKNILIFPQERALMYIRRLKAIDLLVVDEFYKASPSFDEERAHALIKTILVLGPKSKQRYYLAPNISDLPANPLTTGMKFSKIEFNTVCTKVHDKYTPKMSDEEKYIIMKSILKDKQSKTLIYAGTYRNIGIISDFILEDVKPRQNQLLNSFSSWLKINYEKDYSLADLVKRETGIHNGQLHRSLSQLQIRLFEDQNGLKNLISTSSIIEGVNTSAENVILWSRKNGRPNINNFTYKNIIGRSGRMFRHFIGNVYLLDDTPIEEQTELKLIVEDSDLCNIPSEMISSQSSNDMEGKVEEYHDEMREIVGTEAFDSIKDEGKLIHADANLIKKIAGDIKNNPNGFKSLKMLISDDCNTWDNALYLVLKYCGGIGCPHSRFVEFIKIISQNWKKGLPAILKEIRHIDLNINNYFDLEKNATYKLSTTLSVINALVKTMYPNSSCDISLFIKKLSSAFLPPVVYVLEEYGLPRSLTRKIQQARVINFERDDLDIHTAIKTFASYNKNDLMNIQDIHEFDKYIIDYFYEGILAD